MREFMLFFLGPRFWMEANQMVFSLRTQVERVGI